MWGLSPSPLFEGNFLEGEDLGVQFSRKLSSAQMECALT